jgi:hypothetical protein
MSNSTTGYSPENLEDVFNAIGDRKMCIAQNSENDLSVWWNEDYLNNLVLQINGNSMGNCIEGEN